MPGTKLLTVAAAGLALLATVGTAAAQGFGPPPGQGFGPAPTQGFGPPPGQAAPQPGFVAAPPTQPQGGMPPCANEFIPLRDQVQKAGMAVKAAIDKKAERSEICNRLKYFTGTEAKFVKYLETNAGWCGIPADAIQQVRAGLVHSSKLRDQACAAGAAGPRIAPGPGLSDALGTNRPPPDTTKKGAGTFDTLSGSVLRQ